MRSTVGSLMLAIAWKVIRHSVPAVIRIAVAMFLWMVGSNVALFTGARSSVNIMADEWARRVSRNVGHDPVRGKLYRFFQGVAWLTLIVGEILTAIAIVGLLSIVF